MICFGFGDVTFRFFLWDLCRLRFVELDRLRLRGRLRGRVRDRLRLCLRVRLWCRACHVGPPLSIM